MSRAEFAKFGNAAAEKSPLPQPTPPVDQPQQPDRESFAAQDIRILLFDEDPTSAATIRGVLHEAFGDGCVCDWVSDREEAAEQIRVGSHDVHLCVDGPQGGDALALVRASVDAGNTAAVILLAPAANADFDLKMVEAGADDYMILDGLTAGALERSIRHALIRQARFAKALQEIAGLTGEKTRLNILRDANHQFVENACHDFRSPLTVIKEFAAIIEEGLTGEINEEQTEFLQIILTRVDQLSQMVDGILDASRLESDLIGVKREEQSVASLVEKVRPTLEQKAVASNVAIEFDVPELASAGLCRRRKHRPRHRQSRHKRCEICRRERQHPGVGALQSADAPRDRRGHRQRPGYRA